MDTYDLSTHNTYEIVYIIPIVMKTTLKLSVPLSSNLTVYNRVYTKPILLERTRTLLSDSQYFLVSPLS